MNPVAKILVVDDTPQNVLLLADLLASRGHTVVTAASGAEALRRIDDDAPDLVLLDVVMPEMSGWEVCRTIRANPATAVLPVIMVTALDPAQERPRRYARAVHRRGHDDRLQRSAAGAESGRARGPDGPRDASAGRRAEGQVPPSPSPT